MILLHSLNGSEFYLNNDLIVKVEALPDTVITLTDGKTLRVKEAPQVIIDRITQYKRSIFLGDLDGGTGK